MGKGEAFKSVYESAPISAIILLILSNLFIFGQDWVLFTGVENHALIFAKNYNDGDILLANGMPIPQAWTLGIELSFYVIAPFVLPRKYLIVTFLAISIAIRQYLYSIGVGVYRFFPAELAFFLLGALANQFILPHYKKLSKGNGSIYSTLATVYLIIYTIIYPYIPGAEIIKWSILFGSFFFLLPFIFDFQNHHKFDSWIGEYSYPIYIGHMLILWTINALFKNSNIVNSYLFPTICLVLSLLFAGFLYHFIGKPIDIYRKKFAKKLANSRMARAVVKS
jgi:peptidoglycan/LPS O-acetylase OafA/YrhL